MKTFLERWDAGYTPNSKVAIDVTVVDREAEWARKIEEARKELVERDRRLGLGGIVDAEVV